MKKIAALPSLYLSLALLVTPLVASAQALQPIRNLIVALGGILNITIPVLIAAAIVVFFWGLVLYIYKAGGEGTSGRGMMVAGLVSLFIMVSVWGLVNLAQGALGVSGNANVVIPQVPTAQY
jgi:hypothetical protein